MNCAMLTQLEPVALRSAEQFLEYKLVGTNVYGTLWCREF